MTFAKLGLVCSHETQNPACCGGLKLDYLHLRIVIYQVFTAFGDVEKFLKNDDLPLATSTKLLQVFDDPAKTRKLKIEIPTTVDAMEPFVKATYKLEGDGALSLVAYQQLSRLYASVSNQHYPNVVAVVKAEAKGNATYEQQSLTILRVVCSLRTTTSI